MKRLLFLVPIVLAGCHSTTYVHRADSSDTTPTTSWHAAPGSQRTDDPITIRHSDPAVPARSTQALTREQVLDLANKGDVGDAIAEIDRHPLGFPLSKENMGWFEDRVAPPELLDYLRKRSAIDWDALARAPAPTPQPALVPEPPAAAPDYPYQTPDSQPPRTTVYVDETPPPSTTIYESSDPYYYGPVLVGGVWVYGPYYGRYYGRGGYYRGGGGGGYYRNYSGTVGPAGATNVAPAAGLYVRPQGQVIRSSSSRSWSSGGHGGGHGGGGHR